MTIDDGVTQYPAQVAAARRNGFAVARFSRQTTERLVADWHSKHVLLAACGQADCVPDLCWNGDVVEMRAYEYLEEGGSDHSVTLFPPDANGFYALQLGLYWFVASQPWPEHAATLARLRGDELVRALLHALARSAPLVRDNVADALELVLVREGVPADRLAEVRDELRRAPAPQRRLVGRRPRA